MKILVLNGSPRHMVCHKFCEAMVEANKDYGHTINVVNLYDYDFGYCQGCKSCEKTHKCIQEDSFTRDIAPLYVEADLIVFATPDYFAMPSAVMKNFMDRSYSTYTLVSAREKEYAVFISAESDYYGCMSVYERVQEYAELMGMREHCEPYFQMNAKDSFDVDEKLNEYIIELLMKRVYVDIDPVDEDEALDAIDD